MKNEISSFENNRESLLMFLWKKRKTIIILTALGTLVSIVISLLLTPVYKSTAIVFPTATSTVSFSEQRNAKAGSMDFGESEQAEQLLQILQASSIRDRIVEEFDLMNHYEIAEDDKVKHHKLTQQFNENFNFTRTRYGSIQIDVYDREPKQSMLMVNRIVDLIDTVKNELIRQRTGEAFKVAQRKKLILEGEIQIVAKAIDSLTQLGVLNIDSRSGLYQAYVDAKVAGEKTEIKSKIVINEKEGAYFDELEHTRREKITAYEKFMEIYEQAESDAFAEMNHKFVVERGIVADKKDKPKRSVVVLLGMIGTFVFVVFGLLIQDKIRELKQAEG